MAAAHKEIQQIPLDLGARQAHHRSDFQIGQSNREAVGWIDRWPDWSMPAFILHGPPASGKTHLAAVWQARARAVSVRPELLLTRSAEEIFAMGQAYALDGIDPWLGDRDAETTLFHLYNMLKENGRSMMMTMRMSPAHAGFVLPDLASRIRAAHIVSIQPPDDMLLASVLIKLFADRQLNVSNDVLSYLLPRMERSFSAARDIVALADKKALAQKRAVSLPLLRDVLGEMLEAGGVID